MTKTQLIAKIAEDKKLSKKEVATVIDAAIADIGAALVKGEAVQIAGFGSFKVKKIAARTGRNPQTGAAVKIAACKRPAFAPSKTLKDKLN